MEPLADDFKQKISQTLLDLAQEAWIKSDAGFYQVPISKSKLQAQDIEAVDAIYPLKQDLSILGVKEIFYLNASDKTHVWWCELPNSQQVAIRKGDNGSLSIRSKAPYVLAPFKIWEQNDEIYEAMPLVAMTAGMDTEPESQIPTLNLKLSFEIAKVQAFIAKEAGFNCFKSLLARDIGILPNGLPVQVDPDPTKGRYDPDDLKSANLLFAQLQEKLNLPSEMHWVDNQGNAIQHSLFPNPFENI